jgi:hypothetical protein
MAEKPDVLWQELSGPRKNWQAHPAVVIPAAISAT